MFITKYYIAGALAAFVAAFFIPYWYFTVIFIWIGLSLSAVSIAYLTDNPKIFRKKENGAIPFYVQWLFIPFLMGAQFYNSWARKNDSVPAIQEIAPDLYLACRLFPSDIVTLKEFNVSAILDATAEFSGLNWSAEDSELSYLNVPILDHQSPHQSDLVAAVNWIDNHVANGRGVVVHCALGRGRSVLIMAAYLLASDRASNVDEALKIINQVRGTARLNSSQYNALKRIHDSGVLRNKKRLLVVANPVSGGGTWDNIKLEIEQRLSVKFQLDIHLTSEQLSATEIANRYKSKRYEYVVACGGDGTVNAVAKALIGTSLPLAIIPAGTTNALGHALYGSAAKLRPIEIACDLILEGGVCRMDTAVCNDDVMLLVAGLGFEQRMITHASRAKKDEKGELAYVQALASAMKENESKQYSIKVDDQPSVIIQASSLVVANSSPFTTILAQGKGEPDPFDGKLDMTIVNTDDSIVIPIASLGLKAITPDWMHDTEVQGVKHQRICSVIIESDDDLDYVVDGEVRKSKIITIKIEPESLSVVCAKGL